MRRAIPARALRASAKTNGLVHLLTYFQPILNTESIKSLSEQIRESIAEANDI